VEKKIYGTKSDRIPPARSRLFVSVLPKREELADFGGRLLFILRMEMTLGYLDGYRVLRQPYKK
jgi:hypothetical protein